MFGTQLHWTTFWFIVFQLVFLCIFILIFQTRRSEDSFKRMILLTSSYLFFNIASGLFPDEHLFLPVFYQNLISYYSGLHLGVVLLYYCCVEFDIQPLKYFSPRKTAYLLIATFLFAFVVPYGFTDDLWFSKKIFLLIPIILTTAYLIQMTKVIASIWDNHEERDYFKPKLIAAYISFLCICLLPYVVYLGDWQYIEQPMVNLGYLGLVGIYIAGFIKQSRREYHFFKKKIGLIEGTSQYPKNATEYLQHRGLTSQQMRVATLILSNPDKSFAELAEQLNIAAHTFSSHAANIYKKLDLDNKSKEGLIEECKYLNYSDLNKA